MTTHAVDVLIFGGGVAGLWTLDELVRKGYSVLLVEGFALGAGQTVASQGIIHGGLKYTLTGALTSSAQMIRQMPLIWRDCLAGKRQPDLSAVEMRSQVCHLWRTETLMSQFGMVGARVGLNVKPNKLEKSQWPAVLANCPGSVYVMDEQVIRPTSFIEQLALPHRDKLLLAAPDDVKITTQSPGQVTTVTLECENEKLTGLHQTLTIAPRFVILAAGAGNAALRQHIGLEPSAMQRRPLHMAIARGKNLPVLNGHCVDGAKTRVTVTTDHDAQGNVIWQVGGQVSEDGVAMEPQALIRHTISELRACIPDLDLADVQWTTHRVDRAEASTEHGRRPDDVHLTRQGNTFTAWPTKLALAPRLAELLMAQLDAPAVEAPSLPNWPSPPVALPPWETDGPWWPTADVLR